MSDTKRIIALQELLHRRGWNIRAVKTFLEESDRAESPEIGPREDTPLFHLSRVEAVEATRDWKTHAENLEHKRERQKQRELERWERERPTYLQVGKIDLDNTCRIAVPAFPGLENASSDSSVYDLAVVDDLAKEPWKTVLYRIQGKGGERLTFSLYAFSESLVSVNLEGDVTDDQIRDLYPFLMPTWEPSLFERNTEAAFRAVEGEHISWKRIWGPQRLPFRLLALFNGEKPAEALTFLEEMNALFLTTRRKRKNTPYNTFIQEGYHSFASGCAVPAGGADGVGGIFVHRNGNGLIDGIWIDLDLSENRD